jgi:glyoxylase-like metal-dependent hydrolase (beta-lactamase superfamily II)
VTDGLHFVVQGVHGTIIEEMLKMEEILPRLYRIVVPLPGNPLKEINSYVLTSDDRNLIIDTGMNRPECREALEAGFAEIGLDLERTDIIVTHMHVDHQGLVATFLAEGSKAYMGEADATLLKSRKTPHARMSPFAQYAVSSGLPEKDFEITILSELPPRQK